MTLPDDVQRARAPHTTPPRDGAEVSAEVDPGALSDAAAAHGTTLREAAQSWALGRDSAGYIGRAPECAGAYAACAAAPARLHHLVEIGQTATLAGAAGAAVGAVTEAWHHREHVKTGSIERGEYVARVARGGVSGGVSTAGRTAAAMGLKEGGKALARRLGSEGLRRFVGSNAGTALAFGVVEQTVSTTRWVRGRIDDRTYVATSAQTLGSTGGALGGASAGAALGSLVPGLGTAVGALVGGVAGAIGGSVGGRKLGARVVARVWGADEDEDTSA